MIETMTYLDSQLLHWREAWPPKNYVARHGRGHRWRNFADYRIQRVSFDHRASSNWCRHRFED